MRTMRHRPALAALLSLLFLVAGFSAPATRAEIGAVHGCPCCQGGPCRCNHLHNGPHGCKGDHRCHCRCAPGSPTGEQALYVPARPNSRTRPLAASAPAEAGPIHRHQGAAKPLLPTVSGDPPPSLSLLMIKSVRLLH